MYYSSYETFIHQKCEIISYPIGIDHKKQLIIGDW